MKPLKFLIALIFLHLCSTSGWAQTNFVLNGGFEWYSSCPTGLDQIKKARYWQPIDTTSFYPSLCAGEYCNSCATLTSGVGIPQGGYYHHYPRTGNGMAFCVSYSDNNYAGDYQRDYIQGKLQGNLTAGKNYCITFYVTLAQTSQYAINHLGAYLDNGSISTGQDSTGCAHVQTAFMPQVFTTAIINDTLNWVKIQDNFTANGTERFITLGNFFSTANTDTIDLDATTNGTHSFYLIDDVSVIESTATAFAGPDALIGLGDTIHIGNTEEGMPCEWYVLGGTTPIGYGGGIDVHPTTTTSYVVMLDLCGHITYDTVKIYVVPAGVSSLGFPADLINLYPSPATNQLHIDHAASCTITLTDITGHTWHQSHLLTGKESIDISTLPPGTYIATLTDNKTGDRVVKRMVKE